MLYWAVIFFITSIIAGFFGFGGVAAASAGIAQMLFYFFIGLFLFTLMAHVTRKADKKVKQ